MPNIFEKLFGRKKEESSAKEPAFEDLKNALPENLREEFEKLGHLLEKEAGGGDFGERSIREEDFTPELRKDFERYEDLMRMAKKEYFGVGSEE